MAQVDVRRALKYPPEVFMGTLVQDLSEGLNDLVVYTGLDVAKLHLTLMGFSSTPSSNVSLLVTSDGRDGYVTVSDLGAVRGLDYLEEVKVGSIRELIIRARALSAVSGFGFRYLVRASPTKVIHKLIHGIALTARERELADKLGLHDLVWGLPAEPWNPYKGVIDIKYQAVTVGTTSSVLRVTPAAGYKAVLLNIAADRPSSPNALKVTVSRDGIDDIMELDAYAMPSVTVDWGAHYWHAMRVVAIDELYVEAEVLSGGPYKIRVVYGLAPVTVAEKIAWGMDLTPSERALADRLGLYDRVEAGLIP